MASPSPCLRQLHLVISPDQPSSSSQGSCKQQRRQSSSLPIKQPSTLSSISHRRCSGDFTQSSFITPPPQRQRPRPLSIAIPSHRDSHTSCTPPPAQPRPQTLTEIYAPFLSLIAQKEAQVAELRGQLSAQESELAILKRKWEKIVKHHLAFPDRERDGFTGLDSLDKIIRGIQTAAVTAGAAAADAASEAASTSPSPVPSRLSLDSSTPSFYTDTTQSSPDTSLELPNPTKLPQCIPTPQTSNITRRRSLAERKTAISPSSSVKTKPTPVTRHRDNAVAPLPGTAFTSAAFSLIPQLSNMNLNVNLSDIKDGMDKIISPQQQKRASRVLEGLWGAVSSSSSPSLTPRETKDHGGVNLLEADDAGDAILPSRRFSILVPERFPKPVTRREEDTVDLTITASPSSYLTARSPPRSSSLDALGVNLSTPPIKEETEDSASEGGWNW